GQGGNTGHDNTITLSDAGTQWTGQSQLRIGYAFSPSNHLMVSSGAVMANAYCFIYASGNAVLVTDPGSLFTNVSAGISGSFNQVAISNAAVMAGFSTEIAGKSNLVIVSGSGSLCTNSQDFSETGSFNQMLIAKGGLIASRAAFVEQTNNTATVTDPGSAWLNQSNLWIGRIGSFNQ